MAEQKSASSRKTGVAAWNEEAGIESRGAARTSQHGRAQAETRGRVVALVLLAAICVACAVCAWPIKEHITRGLWLREGTAVTMSVKGADGKDATAEDVSAAASGVSARLGKMGLAEYTVEAQGEDIVIKLPNTVDAESLAKTVGGSGTIEFVRMDEIGDADALVKINAGTEDVELGAGTYTPFMDGSSVTSAEVTEVSEGSYAITMFFDEEGAKTFADVTRELAESYGSIAIVVDGKVITAASVSEEIAGGEVSISGDFTNEEANALKAMLEGEAIPATLTFKSADKTGPLAGKAGLWGMVACSAVAFLALAIASLARHGKLAVLPAGAMVVYGLLILGMMAVASLNNLFVLTVAGVVGGAVAAAITAYAAWRVADGFSQEVKGGKSVRGAATTAPSAALRPLGLPCGVASAIALALVLVPVALVRDVSVTLVFGAISGAVAVLWYEIPLLRVLAAGPIQRNPSAWGLSAHGDAAHESLGDA